jgi:phosphoglucosamine mutase
MSDRKLFGTDGVRGKAGEYPLDHPTVGRLGAALVHAMRSSINAKEGERPLRFVVGRDTRESGAWIEEELARGAGSEGASVTSAGVIPTPAIAYVTPAMAFDAGIVISASHNPFEDNGIKVFSGKGEKFTETLEREVEAIMARSDWQVPSSATARFDHTNVIDEYMAHTRLVFPEPHGLRGAKIAMDTASGATTTVAPRLFKDLGFELVALSGSPDGRNINLDCGSTHPEGLSRAVREHKCRMGVAFDGDGDRAIFSDANGGMVDGDAVLLMCARHLKANGRLKGNAVVATVMSNIGLEIGLRDSGIEMVRCPVGDKYVMEEMVRRDLSIGGEQSGHIIFAEHLFTGDGIATALNVLRVMAETNRELADLAGELVTYPQVLVNVRVREKKDLHSVPEISAAMARVEERLAGQGRLLVRYSGTEPLLRVMLEGRNQQEIQTWAAEIAGKVKEHLGELGRAEG